MVLRFLCQQSSKLACLASQSNKCRTIFVEGLNEISNKISKVKAEEMGMDGEKKATSDSRSYNESDNAIKELLLDPHISITKSRKKDSKRIKSGLEIGVDKKKRQCKTCQKFRHNSRTCPLNLKNNVAVSFFI